MGVGLIDFLVYSALGSARPSRLLPAQRQRTFAAPSSKSLKILANVSSQPLKRRAQPSAPPSSRLRIATLNPSPARSFLASHHRLATINSQRGNRMRFSCFSTLHSFWSSHRATPPPTPVPDYAGALPSKDRQVSQYIHFGSHFYNRRLHRAPRSQTSHQSCSDPRTRRRAGQAVTSRTSPRDVPRLPSVAVPFAGGPLARSPH